MCLIITSLTFTILFQISRLFQCCLGVIWGNSVCRNIICMEHLVLISKQNCRGYSLWYQALLPKKSKHKYREVNKNKEKACKFTVMNSIWFVLIILFATDNINYVQQNGDSNDPTSAWYYKLHCTVYTREKRSLPVPSLNEAVYKAVSKNQSQSNDEQILASIEVQLYFSVCTLYTWVFKHFAFTSVRDNIKIISSTWGDPKFCNDYVSVSELRSSVFIPMHCILHIALVLFL